MHKHKGSRKHFTYRQRNYIEFAILEGSSVLEISNYLGFSRQSIYKEIKDNSYSKIRHKNNFKFKDYRCKMLNKYPFVCNSCKRKQSCTFVKRYYHADVAHDKARNRLTTSRKGTRLTYGEILDLEKDLVPGLEKGQSIHHIYETNKANFKVSERTIRNLINRNELSVRNIDLPMTVRFKTPNKRYQSKPRESRKPEALFGRMYDDFKEIVTPNEHYVQADSVIGKRNDKKVILTIFFPKLSFMFGFLCPYKGWLPVNNYFYALRMKLGKELYEKAMPFILVDRGTEFDRLYLLEEDEGEGISKVFYADAYCSSQRAEIESNHRLIRRILPKSTSFEHLTQDDLDLVFSHINGLIREKQGNKTGYELAKEYLGQEFLDAINIKYIPPNEVTLKPDLLKKKK
jgi:IS30 family transposase